MAEKRTSPRDSPGDKRPESRNLLRRLPVAGGFSMTKPAELAAKAVREAGERSRRFVRRES